MTDIKLQQAVTDYLTTEALMIPVNEGGRGWAYNSYVMNAGINERSLPPFMNFESAWLNK